MVHGLALAETTPGPLDPWTGMLVGSLLTTWVTYVPCFLFILLGAPYVERLRHNTHLAAALSWITAAVVGVIASLAPLAFALTGVALALLFGRSWSPLRTLGTCAALGLAATLVT